MHPSTLTQAFSVATELHCLINRATLEAQSFEEWQRSLELAELASQVSVIAMALHESQVKSKPTQNLEGN